MAGDETLPAERLHAWLDRLAAGDREAPDELLRHVEGRLRALTRQMLRGYPGVHRWEQTDDVLQGALVRLLRALKAVRPESARAFFALATEQVRRELIDLARHHFGPLGAAARHATPPEGPAASAPDDPADLSHEPTRLAEWREFHEQIALLPDDERDVVGLLFYQGLKQTDAAAVLGVTVRTVQRRWQSALVRLHPILKGERPAE
jgi:RNA polymerase sigma-70 factor (ECF subfamily)